LEINPITTSQIATFYFPVTSTSFSKTKKFDQLKLTDATIIASPKDASNYKKTYVLASIRHSIKR